MPIKLPRFASLIFPSEELLANAIGVGQRRQIASHQRTFWGGFLFYIAIREDNLEKLLC